MNLNLENQIKNELNDLKENDLIRTIDDLRFISSTKAIDKDNKEFLIFGTNNYLGLSHHPKIIKASQEKAVYGTGSTGSRLTTGASFEARELEENISKFKSTESTLIFNTGYMTNLGVIYALTKENDIIFSDQLNHASIIDGIKISKAEVKIYKHKDTEELEKLIKETISTKTKQENKKNLISTKKINEDHKETIQNHKNKSLGNLFIISDGVFSMDGDIAPLPELAELAKKYNCCLIIDDAHATGVIGKTGKGTIEYYKDKTGKDLSEYVDLQIGTLSKALASEGGFVTGKKIYIDYLINKSRPFIFSTALSPSTIASANTALNLLKENHEEYLKKLNENTKLMRDLLKEGGLNVIEGETPIIPILIGEARIANEFSRKLEEKGILVSAIRPPSVPKGESRLRLTIIASHTKEEIIFTANTIIEIWKELK
ncbi:pyridoxal phosphate-dependent aminotransferase family protein [uncultured Methanobrevibacter sp.]|uniref:aminotransferase class I/II-fold pyridoxal phosphate-dependent enzyme n=1 Tax=uncultured Methanobrevibacter sp. TaxID=253161 RepID=UPI002633177E